MFFVESEIFPGDVNSNCQPSHLVSTQLASDVAARVGIEAILNMTLGGNETPAV